MAKAKQKTPAPDVKTMPLPFDEMEARPADAGELSRISELAKRQLKLEDELDELEKKMSELGAEFRKLSEVDLPEAMAEVGMTEFALDTGEKIKIKKVIRANISAERSERAFAWLEKNGAGSLIKSEFKLAFGKGQEKLIDKARKLLSKNSLAFEEKRGVHGNTLTAFIKERIEEGKPIDVELFGVFEGKVATITVAK